MTRKIELVVHIKFKKFRYHRELSIIDHRQTGKDNLRIKIKRQEKSIVNNKDKMRSLLSSVNESHSLLLFHATSDADQSLRDSDECAVGDNKRVRLKSESRAITSSHWHHDKPKRLTTY